MSASSDTRETPQRTCNECGGFIQAPQELERALPGLNILSSAFGSVRGATGLCTVKETFITAQGACERFSPGRAQ